MDPINASVPSCPGRILVVEDDPHIGRLVAQMLDQLGYLTVRAGHAQEALGCMQSQQFDLILIDYRMPDMTGLDLVRMLRQDNCKIPVTMMTGYPTTEDRIFSEKLGIFAFLKKPFTVPQLAQAVTDSLRGTVTELGTEADLS